MLVLVLVGLGFGLVGDPTPQLLFSYPVSLSQSPSPCSHRIPKLGQERETLSDAVIQDVASLPRPFAQPRACKAEH